MQNKPTSNKSRVKRVPKRAAYDRETIYPILDRQYLCHVAFVHQDYPVVIPTMYGRSGDKILIHGASVSRMITDLEQGIPVSVSIAQVNGIVLARSAFHHSLNYESVVIFGKGKLVPESEKLAALKIISDHIIPHRWEEARQPNEKELKATKVIEISMEEVTAKVRTGGPVDDKEDYALDIWAGVLPVERKYIDAVADEQLKAGLSTPPSVLAALTKQEA